MCFQVYLGTSQECMEIPYSERWDHIFVLRHPEHNGYPGDVSLHSKYLYHVGVMSCGCGLPYDFPVGQHDERTQTNHRQFVDYLRGCLQNAEPVEVFTSWSGEESLPIEKQRWIALDELSTPEFTFAMRQLTVIYRDQNSLQSARRAKDTGDLNG
jgi:hypothetical protein